MKLQSFFKDTLSFISLIYIILCLLITLLCYVIAPDNSNNANQMHLEIQTQPPGFSTEILSIPNKKKTPLWKIFLSGEQYPNKEILLNTYFVKSDTLWVESLENKGIFTPFASNIFFKKPFQRFIQKKIYYLGTDKYGRDVLSRLLIGMRVSFSIGFVAVFISLIIGISIGAIGGYFGGKIDNFVMWFIQVTWSIPSLLLVIAITLALGKGYWQVFIAVGLTMWVEVARVVRGQIISIKNNTYIIAAKTLGYGYFRIIHNHILPNVIGSIVVISAANFASAILIESGLSFLGIGTQPPTPSWGMMIKNHFSYMILGKGYLVAIPGAAIVSLVMAFMILGNRLTDILKIKTH